VMTDGFDGGRLGSGLVSPLCLIFDVKNPTEADAPSLPSGSSAHRTLIRTDPFP
jgi:hypothetical protein